MNDYKIVNLFDLNESIAKILLEKHEYPWEVLKDIKDYIISLGKELSKDDYEMVQDNIWIHKSARVYASAFIDGPTIIDKEAEIRHGAFIRGSAIVGANAVVGNSTELKNVVLFNNVEVPHFNYVGDSILGHKAHLGAGAITSNIKSDRSNIVINTGDERIETGLRKIGAILADNVEVGCNSVLNPGTIIGKNTTIYPLSSVRGVVPKDSIYKSKDEIIPKQKVLRKEK